MPQELQGEVPSQHPELRAHAVVAEVAHEHRQVRFGVHGPQRPVVPLVKVSFSFFFFLLLLLVVGLPVVAPPTVIAVASCERYGGGNLVRTGALENAPGTQALQKLMTPVRESARRSSFASATSCASFCCSF